MRIACRVQPVSAFTMETLGCERQSAVRFRLSRRAGRVGRRSELDVQSLAKTG